MKASRVLLTLFLLLGITLTNCDKEESCPPIEGAYFDIQEIESLVHHYRLSETASPPLEPNSVIPYSTYSGLLLEYSIDYISSKIELNRPTNSGQLYALSCISNGEGGSKFERYEKITVITMNDFNSQYNQGDTINELIRIGSQLTIEEYLSSQETNNINQTSLFFELTEKPMANPKYQVEVIVELNTGEIYSKQSANVEFND